MTKKLAIWFCMTLSLTFFGCEDPISIDLPSGESFVVVEGWITNQPGPYRIRLSETLPFDSPETNPPVSNAVVSIATNRGANTTLTEDPARPGDYLTDSASFVGEAGIRYTLEVRIGEKVIISSSEMLNESPIFDTLTSTFVENIFVPETLSFTSGYLVTGFVSDPDTRDDYYRWEITKNGSVYDKAENLVLITDRFFNGKTFGFELSSILFQSSDTVTIQQYSLNKQSFEFLRNLNTQAIGLGKSSSTPPSLVRGNLQNINDRDEIVLGYFGVSGVSSATLIIEDQQ